MDKGRLRSFLVLLPIIAVLIALSWPAAAPAKGLSPHEEELARRIRFDRSVVLMVILLPAFYQYLLEQAQICLNRPKYRFASHRQSR